MKVLKHTVIDLAQIKEQYLPGLQNGGLFVPGVTDLQVGEEVCLWTILRELGTDLHLTGTVYWVRHRTGLPRQRLASGSGVGFKAGQEEPLAYLQRVLEGEHPAPPERKQPRTPLLSPWRCQLLPAEVGGTTRSGLLVDISAGGARLVTGAWEHDEAVEIEISLPWHSGAWHRMHVEWQRPSSGRIRLGLSRAKASAALDREWTGLVNQARKAFVSQVWGRTTSGSHLAQSR
jgi:Tfp pilus assembly protein PilZ